MGAPHDGDVTTAFQYGTSTNYELGTASRAVPAGDTAVPVTRDLSGLQPNTTYHYRFVATRGGVAYPGADRTFKTLPAVAPPTPTPTPTPTPQPPDERPVGSTRNG